MALLGRRDHEHRAVARRDSTVLAVEETVLTRLGEREPRVLVELARVLSERLRSSQVSARRSSTTA